ncbi:MAG: DNA-binding protein [Alkalibacterium sp.]|nr:DNA-binding protein [Alkalibacterium sp.]
MEENNKVALIADIVASKQIKDRKTVQELLNSLLDSINTQFKESIASNLTITLGDEFQGIVDSVETAFLIIDLVTLALELDSKKETGEVVTLRWGIGIGRLSTPIKNRKVSIGTDGPAYWYAREAIDSVHQYNDYGQLNEKLSTGQPDDDFFNSVIRLQNVLRNDWTQSQKETAYAILKSVGYDEFSNQVIKQALSDYLKQPFSEQTVSKRIISTHIKQYTHSRGLLAQQIEEWRTKHDH